MIDGVEGGVRAKGRSSENDMKEFDVDGVTVLLSRVSARNISPILRFARTRRNRCARDSATAS